MRNKIRVNCENYVPSHAKNVAKKHINIDDFSNLLQILRQKKTLRKKIKDHMIF